MKEVIRYQSNDGAIFETRDRAVLRDMIIARVESIMRPLGNKLEFKDSQRGWIQHSQASVMAVKCALLDLVRETTKTDGFAVFNHPNSEIQPLSIACRFIDERADEPIAIGWRRLCCIDNLGREHNQPFYAINGPEEDHVCIEDRSAANTEFEGQEAR